MRHLFRSPRLFMADPADGNGQDNDTPAPETAPTIPAAPSSAPPPPPAATTVITRTKTEADVAPELEAKKLQARIAQLEDEKRRLLEAQSVAPANVVAQAQKKSWLEGGSFFD